MDLRSVMMDVLKHTHGLGVFENIRVIGTDDSTEFKAVDADRTVIMSAKLHAPVSEFQGEFGLGNLSVLNRICKLSNYQGDDTKIKVVAREKDGETFPHEMLFRDGAGSKDQYRFMSKAALTKIPNFRGATWDLEIQPATARVEHLAEIAGIYASDNPNFAVKTEDGSLIFEVGSDEGGVFGRRIFAENIEGSLKNVWSWPLSPVLSVLRLGGTQKLMFSDKGACQIMVDSGIGVYTYTYPSIIA